MDDSPDPTPAGAAPPAPPPKSRRARRRAAWALAVLLLVVVAPVLLLIGLWRSESTLPWGLGQVSGLVTQGVRGSFSSGHLEIDQLDWTLPGNAGRLQLRGLVLHGLELQDKPWHWRGLPRMRIEQLRVRQLTFRSGPPSTSAPVVLTDLRSPLALQIQSLQVETTQIDELAPLLGLKARVDIGADNGNLHRLDALAVDWEQARLRGSLQIGAVDTLALQARLQAESLGGRRWQAQAQADGPLARFALQLSAEGEASEGHAAPALQAKATVTPFTGWPLAALTLTTRQLDLAALSARLPQTAISGSAEVHTSGLDRSASAKLQLDNAQPGRIDEARLPLRRLLLDIAGEPRRLDQLALQHFELTLADAQATAGTVRGSGRWSGDKLELTLQLDAVQPARLDARAAPLRVSGPLTLQASGLPAAGASAPATPRIALQAQLAGQSLDRSGVPVQLKLDAEGDAEHWQLRQAEASAGTARATASGEARRETAGWRLALQAQLAQFDPLPWWRGDAKSAWRQGPHRLNGRAEAKLLWRDQPGTVRPAGPVLQLQQAWRGDLKLDLADSVLAGVALSGQLSLANSDATLKLGTTLQAAGNRMTAEGQFGADGNSQRGRVQIAAPTLAALAPLLRLVGDAVPASAGWLPSAGALEGEAEFDGRWLAWRSNGRLALRALRSPNAALAQADLSWAHGDTAQQPLSLKLAARGLQVATQPSTAVQLDRLTADVSGSLASHQLRLSADSPMKPPAWTENLAGPAGSGSRIDAALQGEWQAGNDGSRWRLRNLSLRGGSRDAAEGSAPWFATSQVSGELALDARGAPLNLLLAPGRVELLNSALRWQQVQWQAAPASAPDASRLSLSAELERIDVASWLKRLQPTMGWSGDLSISGRIDIRSDRKLDADVVLERSGGDLAITDELGNRQALGLTDLRLALGVHDGLWQFAQGLAGRQVGEIAGAQVIRTTPERRWPAPEAPMEGVLQARVANLGVWGTWVPPGWRLAGNLRTTASLGGKFNAPELRGEMHGSGLGLRNLLQGVNFSDGDLAITLSGERAQIERFSFRGGDGSLTLTGGATLGEKPTAQLKLAADHFRLLGRIDRRIVASGQADMKLDATQLQLDGQFKVDEGLVDLSRSDAPSLDGDVRVHRAVASAASAAGPGANGSAAARSAAAPGAAASAAGNGAAAADALPAPLRNAQVAVRIDLGDKLQLKGRGIDTGLRGDLRVSSPGGRLALNGSVRTQGGTYAAYGQKLEIARGEIVFLGSMDNPRLDVLAIRPNLDVVVGVSVVGNAQNPRIRLTSEPEMADFDKLSWLVLGRSPDGLGRTDTALLQRAAVALLAGGDGNKGPTDKLIESLGLTDFSLRQSEGEVRETIVSLGRQLSRRWYVGYERSVNATTGTWQLIYRVAQRFTLRAQSGGENSVDVIWSWRW
ncbi:translocation/assembly module TamB domain-containing protein [Aquabacterium sp.]|uniref:translocation/assembly module TamB domain-containing protein n=1 Tax=Aquabacterium sp. TaxID=1872578 RepID=UPI002B6B237C|nr:translocation/assembly module TamB domain-containing protein [Aquabacterium sp.]HSW06853.1 translocation/assembly module TamB domain-containing protein [Aquabacterium sp.]